MSIKIIFIGNIICGDDGIGPILYNYIKDLPKFNKIKNLKMLELGVIGIDMISYINQNDQVIIIDGVYSEKNIGDIVHLQEKDLSSNISLVSQHDFGVEQTIALLRSIKPKIKPINLIGIKIKSTKIFNNQLSSELTQKLPDVKKQVIQKILEIIKTK